MPPADKFPNEKIGSAADEAVKVNGLEDKFRHELSSGGTHAAEARQALQHEVDLINYVLYERKGVNGRTVSENDPNYATKLIGQIEQNDGLAEKASDKRFHMPAVQLANGKLEILPDQQIKSEEQLATKNFAHGQLPASVDVVEGAAMLKEYQWSQPRITSYEKDVFGTDSASRANQLTIEATGLHDAINKVRMDIINHRDATKSEHVLSTMVEGLNKKGNAHINDLALGLSRYDFKVIDIKDGAILVKSDAQIKTVLKPYM